MKVMARMTSDENAVRSVIEHWMESTRRGDIDAVLGLMTDDVVFSVPGREPFGKTEFAAAMKNMATRSLEISNEVVELRILSENYAFARSRIEIRPRDGGASRSGYTLTVFQKGEDGKWRLARDANLVVEKSG